VARSNLANDQGLDTTVVVRLLTGEPPTQAWRAVALLQEAHEAGKVPVVSDLVVTEAYYALHTQYGVPKQEALRSLLDMFESGAVAPEPGGCSVEALRASLSGTRKPGFVDRLIHAQYERLERRLVSFERAASKLKNAIVLKA